MNSTAIARSLRALAKSSHLESATRNVDWSGWRSFAISVFALGAALLLALYSSVAAEDGRTWTAALSALSALAVSGWVAFTMVPALARRTPDGLFAARHSASDLLAAVGPRTRLIYVASPDNPTGAMLEAFTLYGSRDASIGSYSKGMRQRIVLIAALMHDPELLVLDEPFAGLDVTSALVLRHEGKAYRLPRFSPDPPSDWL